MPVPEALKDSPHHRYLEVAIDAAVAAGDVIKGSFKGPKQVEEKLNHADLVTATDKAAEVRPHGNEGFRNHEYKGQGPLLVAFTVSRARGGSRCTAYAAFGLSR